MPPYYDYNSLKDNGVKHKLQVDTSKMEDFIKELNKLSNKYSIIPTVYKSQITFDLGDLVSVVDILRAKEN